VYGFNTILYILPEQVSASKTGIKMHPHQFIKISRKESTFDKQEPKTEIYKIKHIYYTPAFCLSLLRQQGNTPIIFQTGTSMLGFR
jgi:hypothetical protein